MPFSLLETMRLEDGRVVRLERHLARMAVSARHFGFVWNEDGAREAVDAEMRAHQRGCWRLRLLMPADGGARVECTEHRPDARIWRIAFALAPVDSADPFLRNKTTRREVYDAARRARPDVDDVVLWNERGEVTESTIANVVVELDGLRQTPSADCGLLPGTFRAELLDAGAIRECVLTRDDVT